MTDAEALELALEAALAAQAAAERAASAAQSAAESAGAGLGGWLQVIDRLPSLLLVLFVIALVSWNYRRLDAFLERVSGVKAFGFEMELGLNQDLARAAASFDGVRITKTFKGGDQTVTVSKDDRARVLKRAAASIAAIRGQKVLWLDDRPENNSDEIDLLQKLGIDVTCVTTDASALEVLRNASPEFDIMLSDIDRAGSDRAGVDFLQTLRKENLGIPVIFYVSKLDIGRPNPATSFGITNRPDELLHLIIDAFERARPLS